MRYKVKVEKVMELNPIAKSITFKRPEGFDFLPGQHVMFYMGDPRPFTMTSSPDERMRLEFGIKRVGETTGRIHRLEPGDEIDILGPLGTFYFEGDIKDDLVFIAGGSGITPFISMLRYIENRGMKNGVTVIYSNRKSEEVMYLGELELLKKKGIITDIIYTVTGDDPEWNGPKGRISKELIEGNIREPEKKIYFICGPPEFEEAISKILRQMKIRRKRVKTAAWA